MLRSFSSFETRAHALILGQAVKALGYTHKSFFSSCNILLNMDEGLSASNEEILSAIHALQRKVDTATKSKTTDVPSFKSEGNKQQFLHSLKVTSLIENSINFIEEGDLQATTQTLNEALRELKSRQKLIKIADRSPLGWSTVNEYVADELADNSGDEKRLRKVIRVLSITSFK